MMYTKHWGKFFLFLFFKSFHVRTCNTWDRQSTVFALCKCTVLSAFMKRDSADLDQMAKDWEKRNLGSQVSDFVWIKMK